MKNYDKGFLKIGIPGCSEEVLHRDTLYQLCRDLKQKIIYVVANLGWGKTTVFSDWARLENASFYWISLEARHNDQSKLEPYLKEAILALKDKKYAIKESSHIIVLDDFHKITDQKVLRF